MVQNFVTVAQSCEDVELHLCERVQSRLVQRTNQSNLGCVGTAKFAAIFIAVVAVCASFEERSFENVGRV